MEPSLPDSSPCPGISRGRMEGEGGCQWEHRRSWGASQTEYPECQLDPMTACELPEKMARGPEGGGGIPKYPEDPILGGLPPWGRESSWKSPH